MQKFPWNQALIGLGLGLLPALAPCQGQSAAVPALATLASEWQSASGLLSLPALNNLRGSAQVAPDLVAVGKLSFPPLTMTGTTGALSIDGVVPRLDRVRWYPDQVLRAGSAGGLTIETTTRMPYAQRGVLFHIAVTNPGDSPREFEVALELSAVTSRHESWGWGVPRNRDLTPFSASPVEGGGGLMLSGSRGTLANCYSFDRKPDQLAGAGNSGRALWRVTLRPKTTWIVNSALALGENAAQVRDLAVDWSSHFDRVFGQIPGDWQERFAAMFTPNNPDFSGHLPLLVTSDPQLRRVYYMSAVSLLCLLRTSLPAAPRVYVSNSPESNCTMMYFWDTREWATVLALLDPAMLKEYLRAWLAKGIDHGYAEEYLTGTLRGPWYSANEYSVFILLESYLNVTGDRAFLREMVGGKSVLDHLDAIATYWQSLVRPGRTLADYGKASNLLECVPTYINEVASFNAADVWMMRRVADIQEAVGHRDRADQLRAESRHLLPAVLALYEPGQGVWDSLHRDGTRVQIRHVFDFATIGLTIPEDLTPRMRGEMTDFVERELLVDHWMRAQSLTDIAAKRSNRPDHGPMGAYCAWPPETMAAMCEFGEFDRALDFLHRCADVTREGPFSQSRALLGKGRDSPVRIAPGPQPYNASNGGAFAETIIREFFGYKPELFGRAFSPDPRPRGFRGQLLNVRNGDRLLDLTSTDRGIETIPRK